MKKWLTFLLLVISLAGTFFPCCLIDECNNEELATAQKEKKQQEAEGNCSPFFACATCAGFTELSKPVQIVEPFIINQVHHESLVVFNLTTYASSFWQPPRFS